MYQHNIIKVHGLKTFNYYLTLSIDLRYFCARLSGHVGTCNMRSEAAETHILTRPLLADKASIVCRTAEFKEPAFPENLGGTRNDET